VWFNSCHQTKREREKKRRFEGCELYEIIGEERKKEIKTEEYNIFNW